MYKTITLFTLLFCALTSLFAQEPITAKLTSKETENVTQPQFQEGEDGFYKYLSDNVEYPLILIKIEMEGSIDLKFTIGKEGKATNIEIIRGFDPDADAEVLRVMHAMPAWIPAKENGVAVDYTYQLTVTFTLTKELIEQAKNRVDKPKPDTIAFKQTPAIIEQVTDIEAIKADSLNREPEFPGGEEAMKAYFKKNMKYPKQALKYGIEGRVVFTLQISPQGKITKIWIDNGLYYECDEEAFYLIKKMPDWIPGLRDGKPATVTVTVPVPFVLPK